MNDYGRIWVTWVLTVLIAVGCGYWSRDRAGDISLRRADGVAAVAAAPVGLEGEVMSLPEFQRWLKKRGYYTGKIDGKVSPDYINSQTQTAWDKAYCDQCGRADVAAAVAARKRKADVIKGMD